MHPLLSQGPHLRMGGVYNVTAHHVVIVRCRRKLFVPGICNRVVDKWVVKTQCFMCLLFFGEVRNHAFLHLRVFCLLRGFVRRSSVMWRTARNGCHWVVPAPELQLVCAFHCCCTP